LEEQCIKTSDSTWEITHISTNNWELTNKHKKKKHKTKNIKRMKHTPKIRMARGAKQAKVKAKERVFDARGSKTKQK
jgi:hypothetical protein